MGSLRWQGRLLLAAGKDPTAPAPIHTDHAVCHSGGATAFSRRPPALHPDSKGALPMAVDPTRADLARFLDEDPGGPIVMLNLLRFAPEGRASYAEYTRRARQILHKYGAELVYAGDGATPLVAEEGQAWDAVLLVRYPSREAFIRMVEDPEYQQITEFRTQALSEAVLQPTTPWPTRSA